MFDIKRVTVLGLLLAGIGFESAAVDPACVISFDAATLDVCNQRFELESDELSGLADLSAVAGSQIRLVKFESAIEPRQREELETRGVEILGYVPYHAYMVRMPPALEAEIAAIQGVVWTGPYLPVWKVEINLARQLGGAEIVERGDLDRLTVSLHPGESASALRSTLSAASGLESVRVETAKDHEGIIFEFTLDRLVAALEVLAGHESVAHIALRWPVEFTNSQAGWLHQSGELDLIPIFDQGIFGCAQTLAVLDSGLHTGHCSFSDPDFGLPVFDTCTAGAGCPSITPDFEHRKIGAHYKWWGGAGGPGDAHGHGTHVTGSAVGNNPAGAVDCENFTSPGGITDLDGTAPGAQVISQEMGPGLEYINSLGGTVYHAVEVALESGAVIHNNSWGTSCRSGGVCIPGCQMGYGPLSRDADSVAWDYPEMAVFAAAGNSGAGCGPGADVGAPGNAKNVFSIGSNVRGESGDDVSSFSSRGPASDRRTKPDVVAQGGGQAAEAAIRSSGFNSACGTLLASGTSMASPTAAGLTALMREYLQRGFYPNGIEIPQDAIANPSSALLKAMLVNGAVRVTGAGAGEQAPNQHQGWGRVHLDNVLYFDGDDRRLWLHEDPEGLETGAVDSHMVFVQAGQPLAVTLAWHDYPATLGVNPHIVNRLRLEVETPTGAVWTQKLPPGGGLGDADPFQDTSGDVFDDRNTVHRIVLDEPVTGAYEIRVRGVEVVMGESQPYALAVNGALAGVGVPQFFLSGLLASEPGICTGEQPIFEFQISQFLGFDDEVWLSVTDGLPDGVQAQFSVNPVVPSELPVSIELKLIDTAAVSAGTYVIEVTAESSGESYPVITRTDSVELVVDDEVPIAGPLTLPQNQAQNQPLQPQFSWEDFDGARDYRFQLSDHGGFVGMIEDIAVIGTDHIAANELEVNSVYYWRVVGRNFCGQGDYSETYRLFTQPSPGDCSLGTQAANVFHEDFEQGELPAGWNTAGSSGETTWVVSDQEAFQSDFSVFAENVDTVSDQHLISPEIDLPDGAVQVLATFQAWQHISHWPVNGCYDGGLVEISTDGGEIWQPLSDDFIITRPYDGPVSVSWQNPLAGRDAWCGDPRDFWELYTLDLSAWVGKPVQIKFRFGTDTQGGKIGWYIDDIGIFACNAVVTEQTVGGVVHGLDGTGLVLENAGAETLDVEEAGSFEFSSPLESGTQYSVVVASQPANPAQTCMVANGYGVVEAYNVTDIQVICETDHFTVGGEVTGLKGSGLMLQNNGGDDLIIDENGPFTFGTPLIDGSPYEVTVVQPQGQVCGVEGGSGAVNGMPVDDVLVFCESLPDPVFRDRFEMQ